MMGEKEGGVTSEIKFAKAEVELKGDMSSYFQERDKTERGNSGMEEDIIQISQAEAEVKEMLYQNSLKEVHLPEGTEPMFNTLFITARRNKTVSESGLWLPSSVMDMDMETDYSTVQKVMSVGPQCQQTKVGMEIVLNFEIFRRSLSQTMAQKVNKETEIVVPTIVINSVEYLRISERDIDYISNNKINQ